MVTAQADEAPQDVHLRQGAPQPAGRTQPLNKRSLLASSAQLRCMSYSSCRLSGSLAVSSYGVGERGRR